MTKLEKIEIETKKSNKLTKIDGIFVSKNTKNASEYSKINSNAIK